MRNLGNYSPAECLRLNPLRDALKQARNDVWQMLYIRRPAVEQDNFVERVASLRGQSIGLIIAFEQPWALDWQLRQARRNLPGVSLLVFDNSLRNEYRKQIGEVCAKNEVPYLALPANPTRHANRSHGMAMSWVYENIVRAVGPRHFAFIDHDMIPVRSSQLFQPMAEQPVYGLLNKSPWAWQLWAGYCVFDASFLNGRKLNFLYDFSNGLDTGGRNWKPLYRELDLMQTRMAVDARCQVTDPITGKACMVQMVDHAWFHIGGISYNDNFKNKAELCHNLAMFLEKGAAWSELCTAPALSASS